MKNNTFWLRLSYWVGAIVDGGAAVLLTFPILSAWFFGFEPSANIEGFRSTNAQAAALMWGWTLLLIWADHRPLERKGVLALTIFPVLTILIGARFQEWLVYQTPLARLLPFFIMQFGLVSLFTYSLWANRDRQAASLPRAILHMSK